jgi:ketosteroid isomerase-like protein
VLLPPPDREIIKGSKAALALFADGMARGFMDSEVNTESKIVGDLAYSYGTYQVHDASGKVIEHGNDIRVWRKINGGWKISREIWN